MIMFQPYIKKTLYDMSEKQYFRFPLSYCIYQLLSFEMDGVRILSASGLITTVPYSTIVYSY